MGPGGSSGRGKSKRDSGLKKEIALANGLDVRWKRGMMRDFWPDMDLGFPSTKMEKAAGKASWGGKL